MRYLNLHAVQYSIVLYTVLLLVVAVPQGRANAIKNGLVWVFIDELIICTQYVPIPNGCAYGYKVGTYCCRAYGYKTGTKWVHNGYTF